MTFFVTDRVVETVTYTATDTTDGVILTETVQVSFIANTNANNFRAVIRSNKFATQTDLIHQLFWNPTVGENVLGYYIYQGKKLIKKVSASEPLTVSIHNRSKKRKYTYTLVTVTPQGRINPISIEVWPGESF